MGPFHVLDLILHQFASSAFSQMNRTYPSVLVPCWSSKGRPIARKNNYGFDRVISLRSVLIAGTVETVTLSWEILIDGSLRNG
jgi:hypothetical protein